LATAYRRALESFGAETQDLPDTMRKVEDYGAATCSQTLLHLLEQQGCEHFKAFGSRNFESPSSEDVPAPRKTVDQITKLILRNFWAKSGREHAWKKAIDRLAVIETALMHFLL
jgi:hypothetical protein